MEIFNDTLIYRLHNDTLVYNFAAFPFPFLISIMFIIFLIGTILVYFLAIYIIIVMKKEQVGLSTSLILVLNLAVLTMLYNSLTLVGAISLVQGSIIHWLTCIY